MINKNHNLAVWGVYLIIFFLPAYLIRTSILGVPTTALEIGIYFLFIIWLSQNYPWKNWPESIGERLDKNKLLAIGVVLLMAGTLISAAFSSDLKTSFGIFKGWFLDPLLFFIILVSAIKTAEQKENVLKAFFASGLAIAAVSLIYWLAPSLGGVSYDGRLHAFYGSPNYLAMYLAPALIIGVFLFSRLKINKIEKTFLSLSLAVVFTAFYLTYSYAAWIALGLSLFLPLYFFVRKLSLVKKILLFAACGFFLLAIIFAQANTDKFKNLKELPYRSSLNSRLMIWRASLLIAKDHPLVGIGPGNFQKYYLDYQSRALGTEPYLEWAVPQPHNIFLAFWLETGILGLAGFLLLLFWFFGAVANNFRKNEPFSALLFSLMAYSLIHGLVDTTYWKNDLSIIFWTTMGMVVVLSSKNVFPKSSTGY